MNTHTTSLGLVPVTKYLARWLSCGTRNWNRRSERFRAVFGGGMFALLRVGFVGSPGQHELMCLFKPSTEGY